VANRQEETMIKFQLILPPQLCPKPSVLKQLKNIHHHNKPSDSLQTNFFYPLTQPMTLADIMNLENNNAPATLGYKHSTQSQVIPNKTIPISGCSQSQTIGTDY